MKKIFLKYLFPKYLVIGRGIEYRKIASYSNNGYEDRCPFCNDMIITEKKEDNFVQVETGLMGNIVEGYDYKYWRARTNDFEYDFCNKHLVLYPKRHIKAEVDLDTEELVEMVLIKDEFKNKGYICFEQEYNKSKNSSVAHYHIHLIQY